MAAAQTLTSSAMSIQPSLELDVVGVYTAEAGNGVSAMHMERVPLRRTQP